MADGNAPRRRLTIVTYNIHAGVGRDRRVDPARIVDIVQEMGADVVALQEVHGMAVLQRLATAGGFATVAGPTLLRGGRHYGNAVLTGLPVKRVDRVDLSLPRREPRGALDVSLDTGVGDLRLMVTHLGLGPGERRRQTRRLLRRLEEGPAAATTVLAGDLNEWLLWGRPLRWLTRWFERAPAPATFPAVAPMLALDRIWVRPRHTLVSVSTHRSPLARQGSDHLPLKAVLEIQGNA